MCRLIYGVGGVPGGGHHGARPRLWGMRNLGTVGRDMSATGRDEDLVAGSVVVVVVGAADSHKGGTWRRSPRSSPEAVGHAQPRDGGKGHGGNRER